MPVGEAIDRMIGLVSPQWALSRMKARATMAQIEQFTNGPSGYEGGKHNRLTKWLARGALTENQIARAQLENLVARSWDLHRNNGHARKIVRTILAKVVGRGLQPQSQATHADGTPHVEFRRRAQELWKAVGCNIDYRGCPGRGGQSLVDLQKTAVRKTVLSGECLVHLRTLDLAEMRERRLPVPLVLQLVDPIRLDRSLMQSDAGDPIHGGVQISSAGRRVNYWLTSEDFWKPGFGGLPLRTTSTPVPAGQMAHLYVAEDVDQVRGVPWFAPSLLKMRSTDDYEFNELTASAIASCAVLGVRRPTGAARIGLEQPAEWDLTDADGNRLTALQPGMIMDLGRDGEITGFNPNRPNTNADAWIQHMLRSTAAGQPGVKSSTLTGDYRNSSFSSERSADNDAWPEIEDLQDWFSSGFCQPIYEELVRLGVLVGWFDGVITPAEFLSAEQRFVATQWQGPVARSINPVDDASAAKLRVQNGTSSPQIEAANLGRNWRDLLGDVAEYLEYAAELQIPQDLVNQSLGIQPTAAADSDGDDDDEGDEDGPLDQSADNETDEQDGEAKAAA